MNYEDYKITDKMFNLKSDCFLILIFISYLVFLIYLSLNPVFNVNIDGVISEVHLFNEKSTTGATIAALGIVAPLISTILYYQYFNAKTLKEYFRLSVLPIKGIFKKDLRSVPIPLMFVKKIAYLILSIGIIFNLVSIACLIYAPFKVASDYSTQVGNVTYNFVSLVLFIISAIFMISIIALEIVRYYKYKRIEEVITE